MKTILIFVDWFRPGYKAGGPIQSVANLIDHLSGVYHFLIITRNTDYRENKPYQNIKSDQWVTFSRNVKVYYFSALNLSKRNLYKVLNTIKIDVVYINSMYSCYFTILPLLRFKGKAKVIISPRGMLHQGALKVKPFKKIIFLTIFKLNGLHKNIRWQATDNQERIDIKRQFGQKANVVIAENIPDLKSYDYTIVRKKRNSLKLATISLITFKKNIHFLLNLLKELNIPVEYDLYGPKKDPSYWEIIKKIKLDNVIFKYRGIIQPTDFHEVIKSYHFFVLPTLGENFGHAIYQSLNSWRPVIISDQTPWRNLAAQSAGWDLPLDDPGKWTNILEKCAAMGQEEYENLCRGAKELSRKYVAESNFVEQYKTLFG